MNTNQVRKHLCVSGGNLRRHSPAGHTKHSSFDTDLLNLVFQKQAARSNRRVTIGAAGRGEREGKFQQSDTFNLAEKRPLWTTAQFSLKPSDICSHGGAASVKRSSIKLMNTRRQRCQSNVHIQASATVFSFLPGRLLKLRCPGKTSLPVTTVRGSERCFKWFLEHKVNSLMANGPSLNLTFFFCSVPIRQRKERLFCVFFFLPFFGS